MDSYTENQIEVMLAVLGVEKSADNRKAYDMFMSDMDEILDESNAEADRHGYDAGYDAGYHHGVECGYEQGREDAQYGSQEF